MKHTFFLAVAAALLVVVPCLPAPAEFTAEEAVSRAIDGHPALQGAASAVEEETGTAKQVGLPPNPELDLGVESWSVSKGQENGMEFIAGLSQPLPLSGARKAARNAGLTGASAAGLEAEALKREIAAEVECLFYETLAAQELTAIAEENFDHQQALLELTRKRFDLGDLPEVDWLRADTEHEQYRAELNATLRERDSLRAQLAQLCRMSVEELPPCAGEIAPVADLLPDADALEESLRNTARHRARALREEQAAGETEALRRMAIPEPSLRLGLRRDTSVDANRVDVGVTVGLPLFDRNQGSVAAARARAQRISAENEAVLREETRQALSLLGEVRAALEQASHLKQEVLPRRLQSHTILDDSLELGGATLFEVLAEYRAMAETQIAILESEYAARTAFTSLQALL